MCSMVQLCEIRTGIHNTRQPYEVAMLVRRVFISLIVDEPLMLLLQISPRSLLLHIIVCEINMQ